MSKADIARLAEVAVDAYNYGMEELGCTDVLDQWTDLCRHRQATAVRQVRAVLAAMRDLPDEMCNQAARRDPFRQSTPAGFDVMWKFAIDRMLDESE